MNTRENSGGRPAGRLAVLTLALSMLLASLGTSIANIALPSLANAFSASFHDVQWVVVAYLSALTLSVLSAGWLGDWFGHRRMHIAGLAVFCVASALCGLAPNLWLLIVARIVQGSGAAFLMTLSIAMVRDAADESRIGRAMGLLGTMSALGTALGPSLGGVVISAANWRGVFLILVPIAFLTLGLALRALPSGAGRTSLPSIGLIDLRDSGLLPGLTANLFVAAVMMTTLIVGPFYLGLALGLGAASVGIVMSVGPAISILAGIPSGRLVDMWGASRVVSIGLVALTAGAAALAFLPQILGVAGYIIAVAILTPGYQLFQAANNTAAMTGISADRRGMVSGLLGLSRNLGLVFGASAMAAVFALGTGTDVMEEAAPSAIAGGMRLTFLLAGGMMAMAFFIAGRRDGGSRKPVAAE